MQIVQSSEILAIYMKTIRRRRQSHHLKDGRAHASRQHPVLFGDLARQLGRQHLVIENTNSSRVSGIERRHLQMPNTYRRVDARNLRRRNHLRVSEDVDKLWTVLMKWASPTIPAI